MNVGVALGGGGVRGIAHVVALEMIDELGITPTAVTGTSMGSIVGALYAAGMSGQEIRGRLDHLVIKKGEGLRDIYRKKEHLIKWVKAFRPAVGGKGLVRADGLMQYLLDALKVDTFEALKIPFQAVATDFYRCSPVVFSEGALLPALRASMSIPGVFTPVEHGGRILVDGGLVNNLPYDLLPETCDVTIAIDVAATRDPDQTKPPSALDAVLSTFDMLVDNGIAAMLKQHSPTIYIRPDLGGIRVLEFDRIELVLERARPAMDELKTKLGALLSA